MDCARIRELLSEYIDDVLDAETRAQIDKHLDGCKTCTEELMALRALVQDLEALEKIRAPEDFLDRLHEKLEPRFTFRKLIHILFVPMRVKLPLEFATAAALLILVFVSLQQPGPENHVAGIPEGSELVQLAKKAPPSGPAPSPKEEAGEDVTALDQVGAGPSKPQPTAEGDALSETQARYSAQAPMTAFEPAHPVEEGEKSIEREKSAPTGRPELSIASGDFGGADLQETVTQLEELIRRFQGTILSLDKDEKTGNPRSLSAEIPQDKFETFSKELKELASPDMPPPAILQRDQETLRIRITLVAPREETS